MKKISVLVVSLLLLLSVVTGITVVHADTTLPLNTTISGEISEQKPVDSYTISVPSAGTLTVTADVYFSAAMMELRGANNETIDRLEGIFHGRPENPTSLKKAYYLESGEYTLFVKDFNRTSFGNYSVSTTFDPANNNETEPNNTFAEAMPIQVNGEKIRGFISPADKEEYYKVVLDEPGRLKVNVDSQLGQGSLYLYDSGEKELVSRSLGSYEGLPLLRNFHMDLEAGTYYLRVRGSVYFYPGIYELDVSFHPANNEEIEPNNSRGTAIPLQITDNRTHIGFLSYSDMADYYQIEMKYDGFLTIDFSSEFSGYEWVDEKGNSRGFLHISHGEVGKPEKSSKSLELKKGIYYLIPKTMDYREGGVYTMSFKVEPAFKDVTNRYYEAVMYLATKEVTNGISQSEFGVGHQIKRVDAAIWLAGILNLDSSELDSNPTPYVDVPKRAWGAVNALKRENIVNGKSATHFGANDTMTRGEMALLLKRAYTLSGDGVTLPFTDVSSRYEEAVKALMKNNITQGKSADKFGTVAAITRGEMALFLYRADMNK
ncbi:S-layer homology domain-containing protein [Sporosarcina highlanderae]|uniref:S-layer homology domain-containing protein n=1 Tax=Sporosarcina highlanderae TaxID=3035916 RepID=A0ABT8JLY2_9BACL|nr:S-layer homology domain-containing protein [Sporosarcina highlanderae]MDN4606156.1 S-layer homology domain-containing protein [Sporosarcina highlanderae]